MNEITSATVKVMRSHDYCHFEVSLSSTIAPMTGSQFKSEAQQVDDLRKTAARLADKAVEQYKIAKAAMCTVEMLTQEYSLIQAEKTEESERTPQQKAAIKYKSDKDFASRFNYDYSDDWQNPFSDEK